MVPDDGSEIGKLSLNVPEDVWPAKHARTFFLGNEHPRTAFLQLTAWATVDLHGNSNAGTRGRPCQCATGAQ